MIAHPFPATHTTITHTQDKGLQQAQQEDTRKLYATIPAELLANLCSSCEAKTSVSLLGKIQGKHPGLKALTAWARETLHPSLQLLSLKSNNVFVVTFESPEGRIHALNQADLVCESATILFSSWRPHFDLKTTHEADRLDHLVWVQIVDLCQILREDAFLHTIGGQIGQVFSIDNSEAYKAKFFGPRIRLLVRDLDKLPHRMVVPRLDGEGTVEYALEFNGLPNQCGRCRSHDHQVRHCPQREAHWKRKEMQQRPIHQRREDAELPALNTIDNSPESQPQSPTPIQEGDPLTTESQQTRSSPKQNDPNGKGTNDTIQTSQEPPSQDTQKF